MRENEKEARRYQVWDGPHEAGWKQLQELESKETEEI